MKSWPLSTRCCYYGKLEATYKCTTSVLDYSIKQSTVPVHCYIRHRNDPICTTEAIGWSEKGVNLIQMPALKG